MSWMQISTLCSGLLLTYVPSTLWSQAADMDGFSAPVPKV
jgi:hypothetical protein